MRGLQRWCCWLHEWLRALVLTNAVADASTNELGSVCAAKFNAANRASASKSLARNATTQEKRPALAADESATRGVSPPGAPPTSPSTVTIYQYTQTRRLCRLILSIFEFIQTY